MKLQKTRIIIVIGPPGSGKSTLVSLIQHPDIKKIRVGDILRKEINKNSSIGEKIKSYVDNGKLAPSEIVKKIIIKEIEKYDKGITILFDGFPRNVEEIDHFFSILEEQKISLCCIIVLNLSLEKAKSRMLKRRQCPNCGAIYNIETNPPPVKAADLEKREDDTIKIVEKQINEYKKNTQPVIDYFRSSYKEVMIEEYADKPPQMLAANVLIRLKNNGIDLIN